MRAWRALLRALLWPALGAAAAGCADGTSPDGAEAAPAEAAVTFVVSGIAIEIRRVDIAVSGWGFPPVLGSFNTPPADRITLMVPLGDSLNAFARGFDEGNQILYIGETYFDVPDPTPRTVHIQLGYKGPHIPVRPATPGLLVRGEKGVEFSVEPPPG